ncbi:MAG: antibiotic biosynthesis monooxygenase [Anaerolineales bacterium]|nr:antibiotic biosynthesis monooxygenase [Anaerolineales bacterium]
MYLILWEYYVKAEKLPDFEEIYSPTGAWAELFQKGEGYLGTELLHDKTNPCRYLTIDRWESKATYETFLSVQEQAYKEMDARCEGLTEHESLLGKWILE